MKATRRGLESWQGIGYCSLGDEMEELRVERFGGEEAWAY